MRHLIFTDRRRQVARSRAQTRRCGTGTRLGLGALRRGSTHIRRRRPCESWPTSPLRAQCLPTRIAACVLKVGEPDPPLEGNSRPSGHGEAASSTKSEIALRPKHPSRSAFRLSTLHKQPKHLAGVYNERVMLSSPLFTPAIVKAEECPENCAACAEP